MVGRGGDWSARPCLEASGGTVTHRKKLRSVCAVLGVLDQALAHEILKLERPGPLPHAPHPSAPPPRELAANPDRPTKRAPHQSCLSLSCGGGSRTILNSTRIGCTLPCGGRSSAISIAEMPSDHTSAYARPPRWRRAARAVSLSAVGENLVAHSCGTQTLPS